MNRKKEEPSTMAVADGSAGRNSFEVNISPQRKKSMTEEEKREKCNERARRWRLKHPEKVKEVQRRFRKRHREQLREKEKNYRMKNREKYCAQQKAY